MDYVLIYKSNARGTEQMIKLLLLGDTNVGKTSMVYYFSKKKQLNDPMATIGIDFVPVKNSSNVTYAHVWDTGGLEKYQCITKHYFSGAHCVMIVYDTTHPFKSAYEQVARWYNEITKMCGEIAIDKIPIMIVGNKYDGLNTNTTNICPSLEPILSRHRSNMTHMYTSAKTGHNIQNAFTNILCSSSSRMNSPLLNTKTTVVLERPTQVMHCCY